VFEVGILGIFY